MVIRSLGCRTDLMLLGWDGAVVEQGDAIQVRAPANPDFFYGNFLLFGDAPRPGDAPAWIARFQRAFADDPRVAHVCLRWDRPDGARGAADELVALGFELEETVVLETDATRPPPRINGDVTVRRIDSDADWAATTELQVATMTEQWGAGAAAFAERQMARYRRFVAEGRGAWFGAFAEGQLAADLGVFVEDGLARYQAVETAAAFRRRGICGTLVHHAGCAAIAELGARRLVMVGLPDHTAQIYRSVGFEERERLCAALRRPS
ncbi:MAG TPA: GNAT family N-acetyltransferase [Kofleriaceae bacterium]|nr:GNAT family N-acetyltransferase [Kofleriaceae bacterium]